MWPLTRPVEAIDIRHSDNRAPVIHRGFRLLCCCPFSLSWLCVIFFETFSLRELENWTTLTCNYPHSLSIVQAFPLTLYRSSFWKAPNILHVFAYQNPCNHKYLRNEFCFQSFWATSFMQMPFLSTLYCSSGWPPSSTACCSLSTTPQDISNFGLRLLSKQLPLWDFKQNFCNGSVYIVISTYRP